jgi:indolepyruvate ferredoxin oxidoreductase alpha subunit
LSKKAILMGNEAIARGVVEAGCEVASAYPGTPSSEILPAIAKYADELQTTTQVEWGANEKVAYETALGATYAGKRSCAVMKQVGLDVAADPFMTSSSFDLNAGMVLVVSDDPGCHASQTDQDCREFAMYAKIPCFDPCDAREAKEMVFDAYEVSEKYKVVTMLRPTVRVDHCRQDVELGEVRKVDRPAHFERKPYGHMVHLPARLVRESIPHRNARYEQIRTDFETGFAKYNYEVPAKKEASIGIIASGICYSAVMDIIKSLGREDIAVLKIGTPVPLPVKMVEDFISRQQKVIVFEETYPVIEMQLPDRTGVMGRYSGDVPMDGELTVDVIRKYLLKALGEEEITDEAEARLAEARKELGLGVLPPRLCPGCGHRPSYTSIRKAYPNAIVCSDIGCYGLAKHQNAFDSVVSMGASITVASGMYLAHKADGKGADRPIFATLGDSTFFHTGMPGLTTAVYNRHVFVLGILDNSITAMTGGQDNPGTGSKMRKDEEGVQVSIEEAVKGCGVSYVKVIEAYDVTDNIPVLKEAWEWAAANEQPAVVIFRHPCLTKLKVRQEVKPVRVDQDKCIGCRYCIDFFNCPGLAFDEEKKKAYIDERYCISCGVCTQICPVGAIVPVKEDEE